MILGLCVVLRPHGFCLSTLVCLLLLSLFRSCLGIYVGYIYDTTTSPKTLGSLQKGTWEKCKGQIDDQGVCYETVSQRMSESTAKNLTTCNPLKHQQ